MLEIDYAEDISPEAWGGILSNPMFLRADAKALHATPSYTASRREVLDTLVQDFLAKGGKIEVVPEGQCKDVAYFNFENPAIARVQQQRRLATMSRSDERLCGRLNALLDVEQALSKDELCRALDCSRSRLERVLATHYPEDKRVDHYRADIRVAENDKRYAEYARRIKEAKAAGAKTNQEIYTAAGMSEKTFYRFMKRQNKG